MILADSNIWLAMALAKHTFHAVASAWLAGQQPPASVLFCRATQLSFLRLLTTRAVLAPFGIPPLSNKAAWATYQGFLADERVGWAAEPPGLEAQWQQLAGHVKPSPKLWMDAYLAAFAIAGGFPLVTTDQAFQQFSALPCVVLAQA